MWQQSCWSGAPAASVLWWRIGPDTSRLRRRDQEGAPKYVEEAHGDDDAKPRPREGARGRRPGDKTNREGAARGNIQVLSEERVAASTL